MPQFVKSYRFALGRAENRHVQIVSLASKAQVVALLALAGSVRPRDRVVDGLAILLQPCTESLKPVHLYGKDCAVGFRAHVEEQVVRSADRATCSSCLSGEEYED